MRNKSDKKNRNASFGFLYIQYFIATNSGTKLNLLHQILYQHKSTHQQNGKQNSKQIKIFINKVFNGSTIFP